MATIYMVRHGKAAAGFAAHKDPGLDETGLAQEQVIAEYLSERINTPIDLLSSPLNRAMETAQPLAQAWSAPVAIEPRVAEIPSPSDDLEARAAWLGQAMQGSWSELGPELQHWRSELNRCLEALQNDTVIFSHFVAINAAVGLAKNDQRMRIFSPDNCSVTIFSNDQGSLELLELGITADTHIN